LSPRAAQDAGSATGPATESLAQPGEKKGAKNNGLRRWRLRKPL